MNGKENPNLVRARSQASFDPLGLTYFLYGGNEKTRRRRFIENIAVKDVEKEGFKRSSEISREEQFDQALRKGIFLIRRCNELNLRSRHDQNIYAKVLYPGEPNPFDLHLDAFLPTIMKLASNEQKSKWLPLTETCEMLGAYVQTELGHGSFVRGLETTAVYDPKTKEFIIDSPTVTSIKFWPGALGKLSNYSIVMASLSSNGRNCGMQFFLVQIRDGETHEPLPGITVGDIGTKFGYGEVDNGFLRLNKVRIPRENMLMRYSKILEDGTFIQPKNSRLIYGALIYLRSLIPGTVTWQFAKVVTIATRYSAVRCQSEINPGMGEVPVMDFQTQQHKLFIELAKVYAFILGSEQAQGLTQEVSQQIEDGNLELLPVLHAVSSGMKAFTTWNSLHGMEQCRLACGGHGYLQASGVPKIYANALPSCTYDGENTVLALQTARFLIKCFEAGERGINLPPGFDFLKSKVAKCRLTEALELKEIATTYEQRVAIMVQVANKRMKESMGKGMKPAEAWNCSSQALVEAAMAFCQAYTVRAFVERIQNADFHPTLGRVMTQLCQLYAADGIIKNAAQFVKGGFMSESQLDMVQSKVYDLLAEIRPNAVALVDAFDFPDQVLDSALGRYDGNVYEAIMESAYNSKLNEKEVHDGIFKYVKPYVNQLKQQKGAQARL